jgi:hypothetical protein
MKWICVLVTITCLFLLILALMAHTVDLFRAVPWLRFFPHHRSLNFAPFQNGCGRQFFAYSQNSQIGAWVLARERGMNLAACRFGVWAESPARKFHSIPRTRPFPCLSSWRRRRSRSRRVCCKRRTRPGRPAIRALPPAIMALMAGGIGAEPEYIGLRSPPRIVRLAAFALPAAAAPASTPHLAVRHCFAFAFRLHTVHPFGPY